MHRLNLRNVMIVKPVHIRQAAAAAVAQIVRPVRTLPRVQVLVRLVQTIHTPEQKPAVVRIVRADNMSTRLTPVAILIH